jgi:hypothetical protein
MHTPATGNKKLSIINNYVITLYHIQTTIFIDEMGHLVGACSHIQGARGIDARFLKLSPASAVGPIPTKFSQYTPTPPATQYQCPFASKIKGPSTGESERSHCQKNPRRMREDGE